MNTLKTFRAGFQREKDFTMFHRQNIPKPFFLKSHILYSLRPDGILYLEKTKELTEQNVIEIMIETEEHTEIAESHHKAWQFILENLATLEQNITNRLHQISQENFAEFLEARAESEQKESEYEYEIAEDDDIEWEDEEGDWNTVKDQEDWNSIECLHKQISLSSIAILECAYNEVALTSFNFRVGWDEEHGVSILTYREKVLDDAGMSEFTCQSDQLLSHFK
jgi:hypothetical protein